MTDLKDFNKPDNTSNYLTEVLDTLKGNIKRVAARDPQDATNVPVGFKKLDFTTGNLQILSHTGNNNYETVFDCRQLIIQQLENKLREVYSFPTFEFEDDTDFQPYIEQGFNPGTVITTRPGDIKLKVTGRGRVNIYIISPGESFTPHDYIKYFESYASDFLNDKRKPRPKISGTALGDKVLENEYYDRDSPRVIRDTRPLTDYIKILTEDLSGNSVVETVKLYRYNIMTPRDTIPIMNTPYISGLPFIRKDFVDHSYVPRPIKYDLPHFGLQETPFVDDKDNKYGPAKISVGYGGLSTTFSYSHKPYKLGFYISRETKDSFSEYLELGDLTITIPRNDQVLTRCIGKAFPAIEGSGEIRYNPWIHGGMPGGRGAVIIEPVLKSGE